MSVEGNFVVKHEFGSLMIYESKHPWFNIFRPSRKVYWSCTRLLKQAGPFPTVYDALSNYKTVREMMKTTTITEKKTEIVNKIEQKPVILAKNVIYLDFKNRKRILVKV